MTDYNRRVERLEEALDPDRFAAVCDRLNRWVAEIQQQHADALASGVVPSDPWSPGGEKFGAMIDELLNRK